MDNSIDIYSLEYLKKFGITELIEIKPTGLKTINSGYFAFKDYEDENSDTEQQDLDSDKTDG